jgi:hypothetical protein
MALEGWKHEHGALPERLDQLAGDYFDQLPLDPRSGKLVQGSNVEAEPFVYFPAGVTFELRFGSTARQRWTLPTGCPFLWSAGGSGELPRLVSPARESLTYNPTSSFSLRDYPIGDYPADRSGEDDWLGSTSGAAFNNGQLYVIP